MKERCVKAAGGVSIKVNPCWEQRKIPITYEREGGHVTFFLLDIAGAWGWATQPNVFVA